MKKILIFDLDETITSNCLNKHKYNILIEILKRAHENDWKVYVVTARPSQWAYRDTYGNDGHKQTEQGILDYRLDSDIAELLQNGRPLDTKGTPYDNKKNSDGKRWLYYYDKQFVEKAEKTKRYRRKTKEPCRNHDITSIVKFLQIEEIKRKNPYIFWKNVYFFDDAQYHKEAFQCWKENRNTGMKDMNFVGGKDECVFDNPKNMEVLYGLLPQSPML